MSPATTLQLPLARALLALISTLLAFAAPGATADQSGPSFALYAASEWEDLGADPLADPVREYRALDPLTLEDSNGLAPLELAGEFPLISISADGSTLVEIADPERLEDFFTVRDGVDGSIRGTIDVEKAGYNPRLSADGSRVVVSTGTGCGPSGCGERAWHTYDTRTGDLLSSVKADLRGYAWPDLVSPDGTRLYILFYDIPPGPTSFPAPTPSASQYGPWPLRIVAFDLDTGEEVGRMILPDVMAGSWQSKESSISTYMGEFLDPGIAMSPDGATIAVVDARMEALSLIDAATLEVVETRDIRESKGLASRFLGWLGIAPSDAGAKVSEGRGVDAVYSADGERLYVWGEELEVDETHEDMTGHGFGLTAIDAATGEIVAHGLGDSSLLSVTVAPDGDSLYVLREEVPWWDNETQDDDQVLQRLDADTLESTAERVLPGWTQLLVAPEV